ncbi:cell adhesion molecule 3-like [Bacillus rossius redtenbacheri]|uniref:cell adhesion molecule 3-like n=1 Tax=Bacillus rossius redtenbacheri TaxID=93214 RepID=UPI002FDE7EAB
MDEVLSVCRTISLLFFLLFAPGGRCISLLSVGVPRHVAHGQSTVLECQFDLEGRRLYSVKWYKDGEEFYRFVPEESPQKQVFHLAGVNVDTESSAENQVKLMSVNLNSTGRYRCEVSTEGPPFETVSEHSDMAVFVLPKGNPRITGGRARYQVGDQVRLNCTSGWSRPAARLKWFINEHQANRAYLARPVVLESAAGGGGLQAVVLGLEFTVRPKHFRKGSMRLKCLSTISSIYFRSNETTLGRIDKAPVDHSQTESSTKLGGLGGKVAVAASLFFAHTLWAMARCD